MKPRSITTAILMSLALLALSPAVAATGSQKSAATSPSQAFEAEVTAAKTAMMGDPEAALKNARAAIALSGSIPNAKARLIGEATGRWLEGESLIRVNRPE